MSDLELDPELDSALAGHGWRTYEDAFGDRAELARNTARRIGEHENRAHTRGSLLSPRLIDLIRRELVQDARPPLIAGCKLAKPAMPMDDDERAARSFVGKPVLDERGQQIGEVVAEEQTADGTAYRWRLRHSAAAGDPVWVGSNGKPVIEVAASDSLWDQYGTPTRKQPFCLRCEEDEIGSSFDAAWCHCCGWRGSLTALLAAVRAGEACMP